MKTTLIYLLIFCTIIFCESCCKCKGQGPEFAAFEKDWLPSIYNAQDTVYFKNQNNEKIGFISTKDNVYISETKCASPYPYCCICPEDNGIYGDWDIKYSEDSLAISLNINIDKDKDNFNKYFRLFFYDVKSKKSETEYFNDFDSLSAKLNLGGREFENVYIKQISLLNIYAKRKVPSKIFFNKKYGLLGFESREGDVWGLLP